MRSARIAGAFLHFYVVFSFAQETSEHDLFKVVDDLEESSEEVDELIELLRRNQELMEMMERMQKEKDDLELADQGPSEDEIIEYLDTDSGGRNLLQTNNDDYIQDEEPRHRFAVKEADSHLPGPDFGEVDEPESNGDLSSAWDGIEASGGESKTTETTLRYAWDAPVEEEDSTDDNEFKNDDEYEITDDDGDTERERKLLNPHEDRFPDAWAGGFPAFGGDQARRAQTNDGYVCNHWDTRCRGAIPLPLHRFRRGAESSWFVL
uniref:Uncharacterized protein n=1 Tax=Octactis speculum TaxID=3111310 RepID=A0A7S2HNR2_9STRA|mmetsp:Transcript_8105/g.10191  ORF Transcript_8105/g.10191 Transcript_8105/m.10191 type:complete len:264 (+) Transcript_8105:54-845(+)